LLVAHLQILSFHFLIRPAGMDDTQFLDLYALACKVIEMALELDQSQAMTESTTAYAQKMLVLAACVILRISNSHLHSFVDLDKGKQAYFTTILLHRKMSIQDSDLASRTTVILTELWSSKRAFRTRDGNDDSLVLSCRSRLSMSVVFDCFWRWRREFCGQATPYEESHVDKSGYCLFLYSFFFVSPQALTVYTTDQTLNHLQSLRLPSTTEPSNNPFSLLSPYGTFPDFDWVGTMGLSFDTNVSDNTTGSQSWLNCGI
jgi:hypothetical protein